MRDFTLPRPVDLVLAEFASLNNLADRRDLPRVLEAVARALAVGGWFCFDVNTPLSLRTQYSETIWFEDPTFKLVQRGNVDVDERRARLDFEWFVPSGRVRLAHQPLVRPVYECASFRLRDRRPRRTTTR